MKPIRLMIIACCLPLASFCQDITGLWTGTLYNDSTKQFHQYEIGISKEKGRYAGFSHTWFMIGDKKYYGVKKLKVRIASDGKIVIEDGELLVNNYPIAPNKDVRQLNILNLETAGAELMLNGPFVTNRTKEFLPLTGSVSLKRKSNFTQSELVPHLQNIMKGEAFTLGERPFTPLVKN